MNTIINLKNNLNHWNRWKAYNSIERKCLDPFTNIIYAPGSKHIEFFRAEGLYTTFQERFIYE